MHPKEIEIKNYTYDLPDERIAKYPLAERDLSKLLVYKNGGIEESIYRNMADHLPENSLLVFNNTKVIHARIFFTNATGTKIEIFCLEPADENTDMATAMSRTKSARWKCMVGRASKWKEKVLTNKFADFELSAELVARDAESFTVEFTWQPERLSFDEIMDKAGVMPIPPYLNRSSEDIDLSRYQTVYAKHEGSVAAPTSGLHFTEAIFESLKKKSAKTAEVTLHVGAGTFKPVKSETMAGHSMHAELIDVGSETIEQLIAHLNTTIVTVGTTSLRTIESLYWMGVKAIEYPEATLHQLEVAQWDPYETRIHHEISAQQSLEGLLSWMKRNNTVRLLCKTQILIAPPYQLKIIKALVTNFHQPNSTLLLLVAAVAGNNWKKIYDHALAHNFRFLSYGDGCLLFTKTAS